MALVNLTKFRWWASKVLPTVYDDCLSYNEVLTKLCYKIDEIIDNENAQNEIINNLPTDVSEFAEELARFKQEMTDDFDDFTTAINASISEFETEVNGKVERDNTPTEGSAKLITSGGVYASIKAVTDTLVKDTIPTANSQNYVTSGGVYNAIAVAIDNLDTRFNAKQDKLTFDTSPTQNSTNPAMSGGIYTAIEQAKADVSTPLANSISSVSERVTTNAEAITALQEGKQGTLTFDSTPVEGSTNPVTSGGVYSAIQSATPTIDVDPTPTDGSENPVASGGVYDELVNLAERFDNELSNKQDTLTFDVMPTQNSLNPVTSGGVWEALGQIDPTITIDAFPTENSSHAVSSGGTWTAINNVSVTVAELSATVAGKQDTLTFDSAPTENSENPVTSAGIWTALQGVTVTTDSVPTEGSTNPVQSGGVWTALQGKQNTLTFDSLPSSSSNNPVASYGIYNALGYKSQLVWETAPAQGNSNGITAGAVYNAIGTSQIQYEQNYSSTAVGHGTGYAFTPEGAYNMYHNIMSTVSNTYATKQEVARTYIRPSATTDFTIASTDWTNGQATVTGTFIVSAPTIRNEIVPTIGEQSVWDYYGVYPVGITSTTITFKCATTPPSNLTFKVFQTACVSVG